MFLFPELKAKKALVLLADDSLLKKPEQCTNLGEAGSWGLAAGLQKASYE
jgi:hypothetical protein